MYPFRVLADEQMNCMFKVNNKNGTIQKFFSKYFSGLQKTSSPDTKSMSQVWLLHFKYVLSKGSWQTIKLTRRTQRYTDAWTMPNNLRDMNIIQYAIVLLDMLYTNNKDETTRLDRQMYVSDMYANDYWIHCFWLKLPDLVYTQNNAHKVSFIFLQPVARQPLRQSALLWKYLQKFTSLFVYFVNMIKYAFR